MSTTELDRSMLDSKDREELHAIANAMGVKAPTRMRKSELVDAILDAVGENNGESSASGSAGDDAAARRTVRSARASELEGDDLEALAAEQNALASSDEPEVEPRPRRVSSSSSDDRGERAHRATPAGPARAGQAPAVPATSEEATTGSDSGSGESTAGGTKTVTVDPEDERASYGDGNTGRRRRRRRGRGPGESGGGSEPRSSGGGNEPVGDPVEVRGLLEIRDEGYAFLRTTGYLARTEATCTCRRRRSGGSRSARATSSKASRDRRPATRSTPRCCASTPSTA